MNAMMDCLALPSFQEAMGLSERNRGVGGVGDGCDESQRANECDDEALCASSFHVCPCVVS
jgi:hypothetical protein